MSDEIGTNNESTGDRMWGIFLKTLPYLVLALIAWGVKNEVSHAKYEEQLAQCHKTSEIVHDIEKQQVGIQTQIVQLQRNSTEIRESLRDRNR